MHTESHDHFVVYLALTGYNCHRFTIIIRVLCCDADARYWLPNRLLRDSRVRHTIRYGCG